MKINIRNKDRLEHLTVDHTTWQTKFSYLVCWSFEPSQPRRIISGLKTNFNPSFSYSAHKSFKTNHNISTAYFKKNHNTHTHTHSLSLSLTHTHTHSMEPKYFSSKWKYFFTHNLLQHTPYFIEHANLFQVVKMFLTIHNYQKNEYKDLSSKYFFLTPSKSAHCI